MIQASSIARQQENWTAQWHLEDQAPEGLEGIWTFIHGNHRCNYDLWHEEDCARRNDMGFEYVYHAKRAIDAYNQRRNDFIERMDETLFAQMQPQVSQAPIHSETPGMIIDRLSIMALKHYHMIEQTRRSDASAEHLEKCRARASVLTTQKQDLENILEEFLEEIRLGKRAFKVYFQFKMYNDPSTNPQLYQSNQR
jgi:hypothetical protein